MRAYLQLVRLPNVFTAMADILLGFLFTHESLQPWPEFVWLLGASTLLYWAGMVLNDVFDVAQDTRERPFRPIPSGRVPIATARRVGFGMLLGGIALAAGASGMAGDPCPWIVAGLLAGAVLLYDGVLKQTPVGPVMMGACRTLNVLLGMSVSAAPWTAAHWVVALGIGCYIVGVTVFARSEARTSGRPQLALGVVVLLLGMLLVASLPWWVRGTEWPPILVPGRWFLGWGLMALLIGGRAARAVIDPRPERVQSAVRNCIFSLVLLDAMACLAVQDLAWGAVILALLVPTMFLGRWIYAT